MTMANGNGAAADFITVGRIDYTTHGAFTLERHGFYECVFGKDVGRRCILSPEIRTQKAVLIRCTSHYTEGGGHYEKETKFRQGI